MDWLNSLQQQAQQAADKLMHSEAAERARTLALQATQQATTLAKEATAKAQEVAKEAIGEAEKALSGVAAGAKAAAAGAAGGSTQHGTGASAASAPASDTPADVGITPELERFVSSLTYSTFSDYPLDSLDVPEAPSAQRLDPWQERHARLVLGRVPQLQDLRFVLCPRRMDEYTFWLIYFTLCKRYLPQQQQQHAEAGSSGAAPSTAAAAAAGAGGAAAAAAAAAGAAGDGVDAAAAGAAPTAAGDASGPTPSTAAAAAAAGGSGPDCGPDNEDDDELAQLVDDPELDAYLQDALQLESKGGAGGSAAGHGGGDDEDDGVLGSGELEDLDAYINQLDAEVNADK